MVIFHIFLAMFIWAYWKTIWSKPANPSEAVSLLLSHSSFSRREEINKTLITFLFLLSVQSTQGREGAVWERRASWGPTRDPEESGEEFTRVHTHSWRRYGFRYSVVSDCALFCFFNSQLSLQHTPSGKTLLAKCCSVKRGSAQKFSSSAINITKALQMTITCLLWLFLSLIYTRLVCAVITEKPVSGGLIRLRCTLFSLLAPLLIKS